MSQCCFCNMNCPSVEISFAHNFTRFLNKENGHTAFPSPHAPTFSMTVSNDNTSITREAWLQPVQVAGRFLSSSESTEGPWRYLPNRERRRSQGMRACHPFIYHLEAIVLISGSGGETLHSSWSPASVSHTLMKWELMSWPYLLIRLMMNKDSGKNELGSSVAFLYFL